MYTNKAACAQYLLREFLAYMKKLTNEELAELSFRLDKRKPSNKVEDSIVRGIVKAIDKVND